MKTIAKIESCGWFITHSWYLDEFGLKRNSFELSYIREDGMKIIIPFIGNIRVQNYDLNKPIEGDDTSPYETFEYLDMLNEQVAKFKQINRD